MKTIEKARIQYNERKCDLIKLKNKIVLELEENLEHFDFVDGIFGRVKSKKSFLKKCSRDPDKYSEPFKAVEDMIGIRILTLFPSVSKTVSKHITQNVFATVENSYRQEKKAKEFGYEGYQSIHIIPESILFDFPNEDFPIVFELQVRTLFQHAWAEPEHEINYKRSTEYEESLEFEYKKSFAAIAASCWGNDRVLEQLHQIFLNEKTKEE